MPTSKRLRSASSRCSASSRAERVVSIRLAFISIFHAGVAHLLNGPRFGALQPLLGLRLLELRARVVGLLDAARRADTRR